MPLQVRISINGHELKTLHIGRVEGDTQPDTINKYVAVWDTYNANPDWHMPDGKFEHRYGDPVEVCVTKALQAVQEQKLNEN